MTRNDVATLAAAGATKADYSKNALPRFFTRAALTGSFIFIGCLVSSLCSAWLYSDHLAVAKLLGAASFSTALILIVLLGGELFTGTNLVMGVSLYEGKTTPLDALRVWVLSYVGNFVGILVLCLIFVGSGACRELLGAYLALTIPAKLAAPWYMLLLRGALCNFLVCLGVFSGFRLKSESGKILVISLLVTTFVLAGFEHSIANMAYFTLYHLLVSTAELGAMGWNLLWVTLGNLLGGAVLLGLPLWFAAEAP